MDLNYGAGVSATPPAFTMPGAAATYGAYTPTAQGNPWDFSGMNNYGMPSSTFGANTDGALSGMASKGMFAGSGLGMNLPTLQLGFGALSSLGNLYTGLSALGLAKDQFGFQKGMAEKNMANSVANYNTSLEDRARSRGVAEGQTDAQVQGYINKNKLSA